MEKCSFASASEDERVVTVRALMAGKVKCSHCQTHYVNGSVEIDKFKDGKANVMWPAGLAYIVGEMGKEASVYADRVWNLKIERWIGFDNPNSIKMDLRCNVCDHTGIYELKPNPFECPDSFDSIQPPRRQSIWGGKVGAP